MFQVQNQTLNSLNTLISESQPHKAIALLPQFR